mgnify:CR=1 FL=1
MANIRTVGASGKDHTTIASAITWMAANHDFDADGIATISIEDNAEYNENLNVTGIAGTPSSSAYLKFTVSLENRHLGVFGTGHARVRGVSSGSHVFTSSIAYTVYEYMQIFQDSTGNSDECIRVNADNNLLSRSIIRARNQDQQDGVYIPSPFVTFSADNNVFQDCYRVGLHSQGAAGARINTDYNTFINCGGQDASGQAYGGIGIKTPGSSILNGWNNLAINCSGSHRLGFHVEGTLSSISGNFNISCDTATNDASAESVFGATNNYGTVDVTDSTTPTSGEWVYVKSLTSPFNCGIAQQSIFDVTSNGIDRTGSEPDSRQDFSTDIAGTARAKFTIGAFDFVEPDIPNFGVGAILNSDAFGLKGKLDSGEFGVKGILGV